MKSHLLRGLCVAALLASGARANLIITEIVDATLPGGLPKFVELTNIGAADVDLSQYSIGNYSNGGTNLGGGASTLLSGTLAPGASYVISYENNDEPGIGVFFDTYGFDPDNFDLGSFFNGDDVIALFLGAATGDGSDATLVDVFGVIGVDGTGEVWEYTDSYAYRLPSVTGPSSIFDPGGWGFGGPDALEDPSGDPAANRQLILALTNPGTFAVIPEPTAALLALVAGGWGLSRRRR